MKELKVSELSILNIQKKLWITYTSLLQREQFQYLVNKRYKKLSFTIDSDRNSL